MANINDMYKVGDKISYIYNGMTGVVTQVVSEKHIEVRLNSFSRPESKHTITLSINEIELISGGTVAAAQELASV